LERVLVQEPNNIEARALIAKGYYKAGEAENAKSEFNNVLSQNPSTEITKLIENNMQAIDKATGQKTAFAAYLDFGIGHDSNINSATDSNTFNVSIAPGFPLVAIPLTGDSLERSSNFASAAAGISIRTPFSKNVSGFASLNGTNKINWATEQFDPSSLDYSFGINVKRYIDSYTVAVQGGAFSLNGNTFRDAVGINAQWQRDLDNHNQISVYTQLSKLKYPDISVRDTKRHIVGGAWGHAFDGDKAKVIYLSAYAGKEDAKHDFEFFGHDVVGMRIGGQLAINYKLVAYAGLAYEHRDYEGLQPLLIKPREDHQMDLNVGLRYLPGHNFTIKPQLSYIDNHSNSTLYDFDRWIASINIRKDFNW
jgi:hypothetical protein